eukprot:TRINITY_DN106417_c0_g1_i1.p1 TRINITY_DN106417_c0_g1~~TRINITY_DN106417_c0_g1_i1.p1  ORF type:complete len:233 (-),score=7.83 TRINITY_DN106417_c0_g1_i1:85-783(-)
MGCHPSKTAQVSIKSHTSPDTDHVNPPAADTPVHAEKAEVTEAAPPMQEPRDFSVPAPERSTSPVEQEAVSKLNSFEMDLRSLQTSYESVALAPLGDSNPNVEGTLKARVTYTELLTQLLLKVDGVETNSNEGIRAQRKQLVKTIQTSLDKIEATADDNSNHSTSLPSKEIPMHRNEDNIVEQDVTTQQLLEHEVALPGSAISPKTALASVGGGPPIVKSSDLRPRPCTITA